MATPTSLTVALGSANNLIAGPLTATVTVGLTPAASVQVATVVPVVTSSYATQAVGLALGTITINGYGFDNRVASTNTVLFNDSAAATISHTEVNASGTSMTLTFANNPAIAGPLTAIVTTNGLSSGAAVQVATIIPSVTGATMHTGTPSASTLTLSGYGFDPTATNDSVAFTYTGGSADAAASGIVTSFTAGAPERLTVSFAAFPTAGTLNAQVTTDGASARQLRRGRGPPGRHVVQPRHQRHHGHHQRLRLRPDGR